VGVNKVPETNQFNTISTGELTAIHAGLYAMRTFVGEDWTTQPNEVHISLRNQQTAQILAHIWKTTNHNPRWRLNRNWESLWSIRQDIANNGLGMVDPSEDQIGKIAVKAAEISVIEYLATREVSRKTLVQPPNFTGRAFLQHGITIINDRYDKAIHERYIATDYKKYLREKKKWSEATYSHISWDAFGHEAKKLNINERTQLLKFVYGWLPIGKRRHAIDSRASTYCPTCESCEETHDHILQCDAPQRRELFESLVTSIVQTSKVDGNASAPVVVAIIPYLRAWVEQSEFPNTMIQNAALRRALEHQETIGWDNFMRGFISNKFQQIVNASRGIPLNEYESLKWMANMIKLLWTHELDHWNIRNRTVHSTTAEEKNQIIRGKLLEEANELYAWQADISDQRYSATGAKSLV
jgi:hypothetical protein